MLQWPPCRSPLQLVTTLRTGHRVAMNWYQTRQFIFCDFGEQSVQFCKDLVTNKRTTILLFIHRFLILCSVSWFIRSKTKDHCKSAKLRLNVKCYYYSFVRNPSTPTTQTTVHLSLCWCLRGRLRTNCSETLTLLKIFPGDPVDRINSSAVPISTTTHHIWSCLTSHFQWYHSTSFVDTNFVTCTTIPCSWCSWLLVMVNGSAINPHG